MLVETEQRHGRFDMVGAITSTVGMTSGLVEARYQRVECVRYGRVVRPADAGAASGLINVSQQLGAAVGLAVLVTILGTATHHAQIERSVVNTASSNAVLVHGLHNVFGFGAAFTLAALVLVSSIIPDARSHASCRARRRRLERESRTGRAVCERALRRMTNNRGRSPDPRAGWGWLF